MKTILNIISLSPSVPLDGDVPKGVWSRRKVSYNLLKVFGRWAFVHILRPKEPSLTQRQMGASTWDLQEMNLATDSEMCQTEDC